MNTIHPTAVVSTKAKLGDNIEIAPYAIIHDDVEIGDGTKIGPHVVVYDGARIGQNVNIFQAASIANLPQDLKFAGEKTQFVIGDNSVIREYVTLNRGTSATGYSCIGKNCLFMAYTHVGHDTKVGDNCIIANNVAMGGHVEMEDHVIVGGGTPIHQFCKIGKHAMIGGGFRVTCDIPPFILAANEPLRYTGLNVIGLRRRGFSNEDIEAIKQAYNIIYSSGLNFSQARERLENENDNIHVKSIVEFMKKSTRGMIRK